MHHDSSKCVLELSCAKTGVYFILYIELALELLQYKCTLQLQWIGWRWLRGKLIELLSDQGSAPVVTNTELIMLLYHKCRREAAGVGRERGSRQAEGADDGHSDGEGGAQGQVGTDIKHSSS